MTMMSVRMILPMATVSVLACVKTCNMTPRVDGFGDMAFALDKTWEQTKPWLALQFEPGQPIGRTNDIVIVYRDDDARFWLIHDPECGYSAKIIGKDFSGWIAFDSRANGQKWSVVKKPWPFPGVAANTYLPLMSVNGTNIIDVSFFRRQIPRCSVMYIRQGAHSLQLYNDKEAGTPHYSGALHGLKFRIIGEAATFEKLRANILPEGQDGDG